MILLVNMEGWGLERPDILLLGEIGCLTSSEQKFDSLRVGSAEGDVVEAALGDSGGFGFFL